MKLLSALILIALGIISTQKVTVWEKGKMVSLKNRDTVEFTTTFPIGGKNCGDYCYIYLGNIGIGTDIYKPLFMLCPTSKEFKKGSTYTIIVEEFDPLWSCTTSIDSVDNGKYYRLVRIL